jgi:hypothetical protein
MPYGMRTGGTRGRNAAGQSLRQGARPRMVDRDGPLPGASPQEIAAYQARNRTGGEQFRGRRAGLALAGGPLNGQFDDPYIDLFNARPPINPGGGGGGGNGRGGGGGAGGPTAEEISAYRALYDSMNGADAELMAEYDRQDAENRALYDPSKVDARWNQTQAGVTEATAAGDARMAQIQQEMLANAAQARVGVNQAYEQGAQRLTGLQSEAGAQNQAGVDQLNSVLGSFGAGQVQNQEAAALARLFAQGQITNNAGRTVADASQAALPAAYAGLNADIRGGMTRDQSALMNRIATKRLAEQQANQLQLNQLLGQTGVARIQEKQARLQAQAKLRAELAALGITF